MISVYIHVSANEGQRNRFIIERQRSPLIKGMEGKRRRGGGNIHRPQTHTHKIRYNNLYVQLLWLSPLLNYVVDFKLFFNYFKTHTHKHNLCNNNFSKNTSTRHNKMNS